MWSSEWRRWERDPNCGKSPRPNLPEMELSESRRPAEILEENNFKDPLIKPLCPKRGKVISNYYSAEFEGFSLEVLHDFLSTTEHLSPSPAPRGTWVYSFVWRSSDPQSWNSGVPRGGCLSPPEDGPFHPARLALARSPAPGSQAVPADTRLLWIFSVPWTGDFFFFFPSSLPRIRALRKYFA